MELVWMLNSDKNTVALTSACIMAVVLIILKVFMMYNFWQDVFVVSGVVGSFKNLILYILFISSNWVPISLALMAYMGMTFNFTISTATICLCIFTIVAEAFFNAFYKQYKYKK